MKISRNEQCPCGSGKKYKKCHIWSSNDTIVTKIESTPELEAIRQNMLAQQTERLNKLAPLGIFIDFVTPIKYKGHKVWALGSRVYPTQPANQTFHEFVIYVLKYELGKDWWDEQLKLPDDDKHFIFKCFDKHVEWRHRNELPENKHGVLWRAVPDGYSRALISLAFDVCSLMHAVHIPEEFLKKLRKYQDYQSVRYEIAIAAIFARMGYKIHFLDEEFANVNPRPKHADFVAIHPTTGEEIVVEVKSKARDGILHQEGTFIEKNESKSSIASLYRDALKQKQSGKPFIVFIDMNLPPSPGITPDRIKWVQMVTSMRDRAIYATKGLPSPTNAIIFTNYSYHYNTDKETDGYGEFLLEGSANPEYSIQSSNFDERFISAIRSYGNVPNIDMEIEA